MQLGFFFDQTRCTGCDTCVVACKDWHDVPAGPASWRRVTTIEKGRFPALFVAFLSRACFHCSQPACVAVCPASAIRKRDSDGIVEVDPDQCDGRDHCGLCRQACPYGAPQFGAEDNPKIQKCDLCCDRWAENKKPICVDGCPMRALDAGPLHELRRKYGDVREAEGFQYRSDFEPSVVFKPKPESYPYSGQSGTGSRP